MKTLLIPVDFSATSNNAADYAADLANYRGVERIILLANFYVSEIEQLYPSADFVQSDQQDWLHEKRQLNHKLTHFRLKLLEKLNPGIEVDQVLDESSLLRSVLDTIDRLHPDLMVVGSNSESDDGSYIGTNLIELAKTSPIPVMIVPPKSHYEPVTRALVACDFSTFDRAGLLHRLEKIKSWPHPTLSLLNVDPTQKHLKADYPKQQIEELVNQVLKGYDFHLNYSCDKEVLSGIINFAVANDQQMIISLPGKYSFLFRLTHQRITNGLARNKYKPVLILK